MAKNTRRRHARRLRKTRKGRTSGRRAMSRRTRKHAGAKATAQSRARSARTFMNPYTAKSKANTLEQQLVNLLSGCKKTERDMKGKPGDRRRACVHGEDCKRMNPDHFKSFAHPTDAAILAQPFKLCTDKFMAITHKMFRSNDDFMPNEWYMTVSEFLRESDYTRYDSLYFNILANLCIHHDEYTALYPDKLFWNHFYTGLEEGAAVTGMFDVQHIPKLSKCLGDIESVDTRYLSNTALLASAAYGKMHANQAKGESNGNLFSDDSSDSDDNNYVVSGVSGSSMERDRS